MKKNEKKTKYIPEIVEGTFISNSKGFGFVTVEDREEDLFIPEDEVNGAFHNDIVRAEILKKQHGKRQEAKIIEIKSHSVTQIVGTYDHAGNFGFVIPDNDKVATDIFVPGSSSMKAVSGHKVVVEIVSYGDKKHKPEGKVVEILGHINDPGVDILSIIKGFDLPTEFPEKVIKQANRVASELIEQDLCGRKDLRNVQMITIDGEDAKDLDDAISLSRHGDHYQLGVHIADVSNYVQENSALDREAKERGTSIYLVDRVIPMLPHVLSNGICSLNMGEDRLALSCIMTIDKEGIVTNYEIVETVICVDKRMTYTEVNKVLEGDNEAIERNDSFVSMFKLMKELSDIIRDRRKKRGSIDFDFPESKITLDEEGNPISVMPYERNAATKIIEDFMLMANETVAQHFYWLELPFVYRTHDNPDPEKIQKLATFINNFGYSIKLSGGDNEIHPKEIQKLLGRIEGTSEEALISRLTLRSMKRAQYTTDCTGHFGLACQYYCHFTSPIRRYPDLQIHRIIKEQLRGRMKENRIEHYQGLLPQIAKHSSEMERRADEAERETDKLKKAQFMLQKIGETFEGVISGVTSYGIYVELLNTVEGLIHVSNLHGDYYNYNEETYEMIGRDYGKCFKLGQKILIEVKDVDTLQKTVEFIPAQEGDEEDGEG